MGVAFRVGWRMPKCHTFLYETVRRLGLYEWRMEASVVTGVEIGVEFDRPEGPGAGIIARTRAFGGNALHGCKASRIRGPD
jgi:hypothetical protein